VSVQMAFGLPEVVATSQGYEVKVNWKPAPGATKAEVTQAQAEFEAVVVEENLGNLPLNATEKQVDISNPSGKRLRALTLADLKSEAGALLQASGDLGDLRLVVSLMDESGDWGLPQFAVPPCPTRGMLPESLTGASYSSKVLKLPDVVAKKVRLALAKKDFPDLFDKQKFTLQKVSGLAASTAKDLALLDPAGVPLWNFPGYLPPDFPRASVDLRVPLEKALTSALKQGKLPAVTLRLKSAATAKTGFRLSGPTGALLREFPGVTRTTLQGDPQQLALNLAVPLSDERPGSAIADLDVRYMGLRILEDLSDRLPVAGEAVGGYVITDEFLIRPIPAGLKLPLARVGLYGRAPEAVELVVQVMDLRTGLPGVPLGDPGVVQLEMMPKMGTVWVELPCLEGPAASSGSGGPGLVGLAVRANTGRFYWASRTANSVPQPIVRLAVRDPDPGGRPLRLNGQSLAQVTKQAFQLRSYSLPASAFQGFPPILESDLFLTVDLADLILRYQR